MVLYYIFLFLAWNSCIKLVPHQLTVILGLVSTQAVFLGIYIPKSGHDSVMWPQPVQRFTNKTCAVIIAAGLNPGSSRKVISCSGSSRIKQMHTSYPRLGKGPLWSARICTMGHITSLTFGSIKIHVSRRKRPVGRGT